MSLKKKVFLVFGTRPEAIKMAPLALKFKEDDQFDCKIILTAQHREMLDQVMDFFQLKADYDLDLMKPNQGLKDITANVILKLDEIFLKDRPDLVLVHGDTTTTMSASLCAFYNKIEVGHVEAGLRTHDIYSPFPEEVNRQITGVIANYHFAPTESSKNNLTKENKNPENILVTGNTVIDALHIAVEKVEKNISEKPTEFSTFLNQFSDKKIILVTGHRRENFGDGFLNICKALKEISLKYADDVAIIYPVHLNPNVQKPVKEILSDLPNVHLIAPLQYPDFVYAMNKSYFILTDSGGVQEEAPSLGKPVLVMRNTTERPEAVEAGTVKLVGTNTNKILENANRLLSDTAYYNNMSKANNPYGDGKACQRIITYLKNN